MTTVAAIADSGACRPGVAALFGGQSDLGAPHRHGDAGGAGATPAPAADDGHRPGPDAQRDVGGSSAASGTWPGWAAAQLRDAVALVGRRGGCAVGCSPASRLYRDWYNPVIEPGADTGAGPLAGVFRSAHAGGTAPVLVDGFSVVDRHDVVGPDGWWRTWGDDWSPAQARTHTVRLLFSPRLDAAGEFVCAMTAALLELRVPWLLACSTDVRRARRAGAAVLTVPDLADVPADLLARVAPMLRAVSPALCRPIAAGIALIEQPPSVGRIGEYRCYLIASALRRTGQRGSKLAVIADVFRAHGIDPAAPWKTAAAAPADACAAG